MEPWWLRLQRKPSWVLGLGRLMQSSSSDRQRKGRNSFAEIEIVRSSKDGSAIMQVKGVF